MEEGSERPIRELKALLSSILGDRAELNQLASYLQELLKWNRKVNLTGTSDAREIIIRHIADSLAIEPYVPRGTFLDFGSGAGFPGIPLKLARPDLCLTMAESIGKKAAFLRAVVRRLSLGDTRVLDRRVSGGDAIGRFDGVGTRATGPIQDLVRLLTGSLAPGGTLLLMRGATYKDELALGTGVINDLGLGVEIHPYSLPFGYGSRAVLVCKRLA